LNLRELGINTQAGKRFLGPLEIAAEIDAENADRRIGGMLADTERAKGQLKHVVPTWHHEDTPTLSELGLTKNESARAQFLSSMPRETFDEIKSGQKTIMSALKKGPAVVIKCYGSGLPTRTGAARQARVRLRSWLYGLLRRPFLGENGG
jgi:hypothetical protein